jgi:phosphatidylglycerophosphate synthase
MTYREFLKKQYPEPSVFDRPQFSYFTNLVKWCSLPISYVLFRMGITANQLDVFGLFVACGGFILLARAHTGEHVWPLVGVALILAHVVLDFIDGPIAKARNERSLIGYELDELGCFIDRFALHVLLGYFTGQMVLILANVFAASVFKFVVPEARDELPRRGLPGFCRRFFVHKFSFLSVRFMLVGLPLFLSVVIMNGWDLQLISTVISYIYTASAMLWVLVCVPNYAKQQSTI